ncbi:hypothetical protein H6F83_27700 [Coleofasciculus sp. FACHB-125]|nr:hypothetical protein [Coleofasciculus sp. FACHB-125]
MDENSRFQPICFAPLLSRTHVTYITYEMKKELEEWANEEERSMSWLVAKLIEEAFLRRR